MDGMAVCGWLWIAFAVAWTVGAIRTKPTQVREGISSRLSYMVLTIAAFYTMWGRDANREWLRLVLFPANPWITRSEWPYRGGPGLRSVGQGLYRHQLERGGDRQSRTSADHDGTVSLGAASHLFRMILAMLGTALERQQVRGIVAVVLLYAGFKIKSKIEEHAMTNTSARNTTTTAGRRARLSQAAVLTGTPVLDSLRLIAVHTTQLQERIGMLRRAGSVIFFAATIASLPCGAQGGQTSLQNYFVGRQVRVEIDMPGTQQGVDLRVERDDPWTGKATRRG